MTTRFISITRAWLRQTIRKTRELDVSLSGPQIKLSFKGDEPIETRTGINGQSEKPFYESDPDRLFKYYYSYQHTPEHLDNMLYVEVVPLKTEGSNGISLDAIDCKNLVLAIEPSSYRLPEKLRRHGEAAIKLFKETKKLRYLNASQQWENNVSLRIDAIDPSGKISCRKARYFDQVATNLTVDWASGLLSDGWYTIRSGLELPENGKLRPLNKSNLANTLGVAVMLYERDLSPILRIRSASLASIPKRGLHCTASGVHEIDEAHPAGLADFSVLRQGMVKEIKHEIGLDEDEYDLFPVALARELPRCGKPQLFFVAIARVPLQRIREAIASADEAHEFVEDLSSTPLSAYDDSTALSERFTYEGWACLRFAERFIEANQSHLQSRGAPGA